ncbi:MAG TPA: hypothetical protein VFG14_02000 [Chthoniobacteraceae bacterium]|nr:hypothetical protein [Chthoniobacteraceae bacterium]
MINRRFIRRCYRTDPCRATAGVARQLTRDAEGVSANGDGLHDDSEAMSANGERLHDDGEAVSADDEKLHDNSEVVSANNERLHDNSEAGQRSRKLLDAVLDGAGPFQFGVGRLIIFPHSFRNPVCAPAWDG